MYRKYGFLFVILIIVSILNGCSKEETKQVTEAKNVITSFFDLYSEGNFNEMKKLTTDQFSEIFLTNLDNGIFGMKTTAIKECIYNEKFSNERINNNLQDSNIYVFECRIDMTPAEISVHDSESTEAFFHIEVTEIDGKLKISDFFNG